MNSLPKLMRPCGLPSAAAPRVSLRDLAGQRSSHLLRMLSGHGPQGRRWLRSLSILLLALACGVGVFSPPFASSGAHDGRHCGPDENSTDCLYTNFICPLGAPTKPAGLTVTPTADGLRLEWNRPIEGEQVIGYVIHRREHIAGTTLEEYATLDQVIEGNEFSDSQIANSVDVLVSYYKCSPGSGDIVPAWTAQDAKPYFLDNHVEDGKNYVYRVRARNMRGGSATSIERNLSVLSDPASATFNVILPGTPTGVTAQLDGNGAPEVSWTAPAVDSTNSDPHGYQLRRSTDSGSTWTELSLPDNLNDPQARATTAVDDGAAVSTAYAYQVRAVRKRHATAASVRNQTPVWDSGSWSASASVTTGTNIVKATQHGQVSEEEPERGFAQTPPRKLPAGTVTFSVSATQLDVNEVVTLSAAAGSHDGVAPLYNFQLHDNGLWSTMYSGSSWSGRFAYMEASPQLNVFRVKVTYGDEAYAVSLPIAVTWGAPSQTAQINGDQVVIVFNGPAPAVPGSTPVTGSPPQQANALNPGNTEPATALQPQNTEEPVQKPGRAFGLQAAALNGSVSLVWNAPEDGGPVSGYAILRRAPPSERNLATIVADTGNADPVYTDNTVQDGTKYVYRVVARGAGGEGQMSLPATAVTPIELIGTHGDDVLTGGDGHDTLDGKKGNDVVRGMNGNDLVMGGAHDDDLYGNQGNDILRGWMGDDTYTGGPGADKFQFSPWESGDKIIADLQDDDRIVLSHGSHGLWPSIATILASEVQEDSGYNVYTLRPGLTIETHVLLDALDFVVE